jgi:hypothetical protein
MNKQGRIFNNLQRSLVFGLGLAILLSGCIGGGGDGPAIEQRPQSIVFDAAPVLGLFGTASVSAEASSGLAVNYSTTTPEVCTVDGNTGVVTDVDVGVCLISATQSGDSTYAPATAVTLTIPISFDPSQTIVFDAAPTLTLGGTGTVSASASSGLTVSYSSTTPTICTVDASSGLVTSTGLVTSNAVEYCIIVADQAGDVHFDAATQVSLTLAVARPVSMTVPGAPTGVSATAGNTSNTVTVNVGATNSGGLSISGYTVTSSPAGITATGTASPITVTCPSACTGYAFSVYASNIIGAGAASAAVDVITNYNVFERFYEPDTQPRDSIFIGTFTYNATTRTVSNLQGILSESMTGDLIAYPNDTMTWLSLNHQLSSITDNTLGGLLVTTFLNATTATFTTMFGGDGWSPNNGMGLYAGFPGANLGNAYARIFINTEDPTAALTQDQIDKLAYADCAPGGMMGATCMTGTTVAGYGSIGTMSGYPVSQVITRQ